ncbi:hypothetical protein llap_3009 [Limosa lapponica baueri]|uniref:Uncharacterized protein n=1 Tax=Limosa lapponica baueri TaxID=1758121 RepID=A0A2I0UKX0_LIMLA|nr:hypothetical protein llap_3009 [Limosa lapponica baueri]
MKTMVRQAVPLQPMEVNSGAVIHLQSVEDPMLEQMDEPEEGRNPVGSMHRSRHLAEPVTYGERIPHWGRLLEGPVDPWREELTLDRTC